MEDIREEYLNFLLSRTLFEDAIKYDRENCRLSMILLVQFQIIKRWTQILLIGMGKKYKKVAHINL